MCKQTVSSLSVQYDAFAMLSRTAYTKTNNRTKTSGQCSRKNVHTIIICFVSSPDSAAMISSEKRKLVLGLFFFFISLFNAGFYLLCDVGLYYVLFIVAKHFSADTGRMPSK